MFNHLDNGALIELFKSKIEDMQDHMATLYEMAVQLEARKSQQEVMGRRD